MLDQLTGPILIGLVLRLVESLRAHVFVATQTKQILLDTLILIKLVL